MSKRTQKGKGNSVEAAPRFVVGNRSFVVGNRSVVNSRSFAVGTRSFAVSTQSFATSIRSFVVDNRSAVSSRSFAVNNRSSAVDNRSFVVNNRSFVMDNRSFVVDGWGSGSVDRRLGHRRLGEHGLDSSSMLLGQYRCFAAGNRSFAGEIRSFGVGLMSIRWARVRSLNGEGERKRWIETRG